MLPVLCFLGFFLVVQCPLQAYNKQSVKENERKAIILEWSVRFKHFIQFNVEIVREGGSSDRNLIPLPKSQKAHGQARERCSHEFSFFFFVWFQFRARVFVQFYFFFPELTLLKLEMKERFLIALSRVHGASSKCGPKMLWLVEVTLLGEYSRTRSFIPQPMGLVRITSLEKEVSEVFIGVKPLTNSR
nr:hypothetical protein Iba_chr05eCG0350 [Ipomoea batatas]